MNAQELAALGEKRVAVLGAGREGRATLQWLHQRFPDLAVTVITEVAPGPDFETLLNASDLLRVEPFAAARLGEFDVLIRSPGISIYREALRQARANGAYVSTASSLWFAAHPEAQTLCITATKGKSTTSALVAHMLRACGHTVQLAGNIGQPLLACDAQGVDWWVIELSSYQIADLQAQPDIAVVLNLSPEHLDWHGDEDCYLRDKLHLLELAADGMRLLNAEDNLLLEYAAGDGSFHWFNRPDGVHISGDRILADGQVLQLSLPDGLPGRHNLSNMAAALSLVKLAGADLQQAAAAAQSFQPLPHRLQMLGSRNEVSFVNDSISSTPLSTSAAFQALSDSNLIVLVGGLDRGLDWSRYAEIFRSHKPKAIIGLPDSGERIIHSLRQCGIEPSEGFHLSSGLEDAVKTAMLLSDAGDTVLLSPGAPSFPRFIDFQDRGQQFAALCGF